MDESFLSSYEFCVKLANTIGLFQNREKSLRYIIVGNLLWICSIGVIYLKIIYNATKVETIGELVEWTIVFIPVSLFFVKLANLLCQLNPLGELHIELQELYELSYDERFKNRNNVKKETAKMMKIMKAYAGNSFFLAILNLIYIVYLKKFAFSIFDVVYEENLIMFVFASVQLMFSIVYGNLLITVLNMTPLILLSYVVGLSNELAERLKYLFLSDEFDYDELVQCIKIHRKIKKFFMKIKQNFGTVWLIQILLSNVVICFNAFAIISSTNSTDSLKIVSFGALFFVETFQPCLMGEELIAASTNLMDAIGHSHWPDNKMNPKTKKMILIFMENLKVPMKISFYNLIHVNLLTFRGIVDSAYSLYAVLSHFAAIAKK